MRVTLGFGALDTYQNMAFSWSNMNSAANVSYSTGLLMLTFQDIMSLLDQKSESVIGLLTDAKMIFENSEWVDPGTMI
uniref:Uncharacterized protein n=1 Tax=Solanum lycopersicum TaxID=4081 RepID=A0A3Q7HXM4_SOLLC